MLRTELACLAKAFETRQQQIQQDRKDLLLPKNYKEKLKERLREAAKKGQDSFEFVCQYQGIKDGGPDYRDFWTKERITKAVVKYCKQQRLKCTPPKKKSLNMRRKMLQLGSPLSVGNWQSQF